MESSLEVSTSVQGAPEQLGSRTFKVVVIGDSGVGKTCLTYRFCTGCFHDKPEATIGVDFRERILEVEGERIKVQLWDTAGQERFRKSMVQQYYRSVHAVVLVYDVSNPSSFRSLPLWLEECRRNVPGQDVPRVLVGNKSDLVAAGKDRRFKRRRRASARTAQRGATCCYLLSSPLLSCLLLSSPLLSCPLLSRRVGLSRDGVQSRLAQTRLHGAQGSGSAVQNCSPLAAHGGASWRLSHERDVRCHWWRLTCSRSGLRIQDSQL
uniref:Ras-related protein Rab-33B n=1 Tax=Denticeps clupeoides TaxID=299321 RepID=A0AAY4AIZ8_9TELE